MYLEKVPQDEDIGEDLMVIPEVEQVGDSEDMDENILKDVNFFNRKWSLTC